MSKTGIVLASLASSLVLASSIASAQTAAAIQESPRMGKAMSADGTFVHDAALGGMTEVSLGKLATSNGDSQGVKEFGQKMVDDHTKANDELAGIASGKGMVPPAALDKSHQKMVDKFGAMKGDSFDKAYWKQMLGDHKKTIALFQKESKSGKDADIKAFATKTLPTLQMHLQMVQDAMNGKMAKTAG
jgi:putative membrane protein